MTKSEFLAKLQEALANNLNSALVQENVNYYSQYIDDEIRKGRSAEEVTAELGDPWALAKTISDSEEIRKKKANTYQENENSTYQSNRGQDSSYQRKSSGGLFGSTGKMILTLVVVVLIFMAVISVVGGIFSLIAPIAIPLLVVFILVRLLFSRRQ